MPLLSFSKRLVDRVASGQKRQTVRTARRRAFKIGDTLYLYANVYQPTQWLIGCATCTAVHHVYITPHAVAIDHFVQMPAEREAFAIADGMEGWADFVDYFECYSALPFSGVLLKWERLWTPTERQQASAYPETVNGQSLTTE